jgi:hypothetical protein
MKKQENTVEDAHSYSNYGPKMKKNEELQNDIHLALIHKPFFNNRETGIYARIGKYMKTFLYLILFTGVGFVFTSCVGGYVATEPSYGYYERPARPSEAHIWISGDWGWNNHSHVYVQKAGYWDKPRQGQTYQEGYWQSTPNGKTWNKGHWQKNNHSRYNSNNRVNR